MKQRKIEFTASFLKLSGKILKKNPSLEKSFKELLNSLTADPFTSSLKTHPLKGRLKGKYACSLTYNLRIIFSLTDEYVTLIDIGSHDDVY
jgi:addiction module RelE/StbE family toxin